MGTERQDQDPAGLAGYRVLRRLAAGAHSELFLGHDPAGGTVVIKAFRADVGDELTADAVAALTRAPSGALPALIDLATLADGRAVLVLERIEGPTLPELLDRRGTITPGEAVTILAPLAVALAGLHDAGFAHTTLSLATVRFQPDGRPRLTGLGGLRPLPDGPAGFELLRGDYSRLAAIGGSVIDRGPATDAVTRRGAALVAWFEMAATAVPFQPALHDLERRLFAWSAPAPVRLEAPARTPAAVPGRLDPGLLDASRLDSGPAPTPASAAETSARPSLRSRFGALVPALVPAGAAQDRNPFHALGRRIRSAAAARRGPVVVLVCVGTAATVLALTMLPEPPTGVPRESRASASPTAAPTISARGPETTAPGPAAADDPVAAARVLLAGRAACLAAASVTCLGAYEQPGSPVLAADTHALGAEQPASPTGAVGALVQRIGDVAIVALAAKGDSAADSEPASLLLVKGEAGWRLREIVE